MPALSPARPSLGRGRLGREGLGVSGTRFSKADASHSYPLAVSGSLSSCCWCPNPAQVGKLTSGRCKGKRESPGRARQHGEGEDTAPKTCSLTPYPGLGTPRKDKRPRSGRRRAACSWGAARPRPRGSCGETVARGTSSAGLASPSHRWG